MLPQAFVVQSVTSECQDVVSLRVACRDRQMQFPFLAGQFSMLYAYGKGEIAIGLCSDPLNFYEQMYTIRAVGQVSRALTCLQAGEQLGIRGPFGSAWPLEEAKGKDIVIVAGGLGITSLRSALFVLLARRQEYGRISLLFGSRSPENIPYKDDFKNWQQNSNLELAISVDFAGPDYRGYVGVVTALIPRAEFDPANTLALLCGPEVMLRYSIETLKSSGVPDSHIYLSMERNMKCAIGQCGRCQFGSSFICRDGPVLRYDKIKPIFSIREV